MVKKERSIKESKAPYLAVTPLNANVSASAHKDNTNLINRNKKSISIIYVDQELVKSFLGFSGQVVLNKIIDLLYKVKKSENWPLIGLEINHTTDIEDKGWQYILVNLIFNTDFESANKYLHQLYGNLDELSSTFTEQDQAILQRMIYLDVKTALPIDLTS
jgi:hypothetical protein